MRTRLPAVRCCWLFVALGLFAFPGAARAQGQLGTKEGLKKAFDDDRSMRSKMISGEERATKAVAESAAHWYLYRLTLLTENLTKVHDEFAADIKVLAVDRKGELHRPYINVYGPALVKSMKEVMADRDIKTYSATLIHAGMMLVHMAKIKHDSVNDYLVELVEDKKTHDVIRLYALKALREAMPVTTQQDSVTVLDLNLKPQNEKRARDTKYVKALTDYIERNVDVKSMTPEEVAAVRYLRREAIASLAHAGSPAVLAIRLGKKEHVMGLIAPTLMQVVAGNLQPPPSLSEKVEAAIGLCAFRQPNMPDYDASVATYLIGTTIVEFVNEYNKDWGEIAVAGPGRKLPYIAYKNDAKRLRDAFKDYPKSAGKNSAVAGNLQAGADPILATIMTETKGAPFYLQPNANLVLAFRQAVGKARPANGKIFGPLKAPEIGLN